MSKFDTMSDEELKGYFLAHRDDESFHAYMDRRYARSNRYAIAPDDPEWEAKVIAAIEQKLSSHLQVDSGTSEMNGENSNDLPA